MIRYRKCFLAAVAAILAGCTLAGADGRERQIVMVNVGGVDAKLFARVAGHIEQSLYSKPVIAPPRDAVGSKTLDVEMEALKDLLKEDTHCILAIILANEEVKPYMRSFPKDRIGFVNATAMKPAEDDFEKYGRRVEKDAVAAVVLISGIDECPMPRCARWHYRDDGGLDRKGRNLCPPDLKKWWKLHADLSLQGDVDKFLSPGQR